MKNVSDNYDIYDDITLNERVELIEEEQDIQAIEELAEINLDDVNGYDLDNEVVLNRNKINEIIKVLKQIERK